MSELITKKLTGGWTIEYKEVKPAPITGVAEWVADLRSGKHIQGCNGNLRSLHDEFCCLGRKADLEHVKWEMEKDGEFPRGYRAGESTTHYTGNCGLSRSGGLPCRISFYSPENVFRGTSDTLTSINDEGVPFPVIADIIELLFVEKESQAKPAA